MKPTFIIISKQEAKIRVDMTFREVGDETPHSMTYHTDVPFYGNIAVPDGYVCVSEVKGWEKECIYEYDHEYDEGYAPSDFYYWCLEINGTMYESTDNSSKKPDWATHYSYYSQ